MVAMVAIATEVQIRGAKEIECPSASEDSSRPRSSPELMGRTPVSDRDTGRLEQGGGCDPCALPGPMPTQGQIWYSTRYTSTPVTDTYIQMGQVQRAIFL